MRDMTKSTRMLCSERLNIKAVMIFILIISPTLMHMAQREAKKVRLGD